MKHIYTVYAWKSILIVLILVVLNNAAMAQVPQDTVKPKVDTTTMMHADTTKPVQPAPAATMDTATNKTAAKKHKQFDVYAGVNSNTMSGSTASYNANAGTGYQIGIAWQKGNFTYWKVGFRYNYAVYAFNSLATSKDTGDLKVQALDIPLSFGVNFLSFAKIVSLRAYISAMPSFTLGVSSNRFGISKDNVNSFIFYGQLGIGADIGPLLIDLGYNYGTQSLMKNSTSSTNPGQWYLNLGIRF
jgi:Outer membrane protein beta-barrel domain